MERFWDDFMSEYEIHNYNSKFAEEIARVSAKVSEPWAWPYQHSPEAFKNMSSKPDFDPSLLVYCTKDEKVVGYILAEIGSKFLGSDLSVEKEQFARVIFPCALPGHEKAADLLLEKVIENLKAKGVKLIRIRTSTMNVNSFEFLEQRGYSESSAFPLDYKLYYQYAMSKGEINHSVAAIQQFDEGRDLEECTKWVTEFFFIPEEDAKAHILRIASRDDVTSHLVIRDNNKLAGYCFAAPNSNVKKIHATFYIEAINEDYFKQLLTKSVNNSLAAEAETFIVDLITSVLKYEEPVKSLGFEKIATWCVFEKQL